MKKVYFFLLAMCLIGMACKEDKSKKEEESSSKNTKWKLVGIMNMNTGILQELEPKDCEECYTLTFDTDTTAIAYSVNTTLAKLDLLHLNPSAFLLDYALWCERYYKDGKDYCDSQDFRRGVIKTESYIATSNELKLFVYCDYGESYKYLLFKPFK
jgi:hypothetical protein